MATSDKSIENELKSLRIHRGLVKGQLTRSLHVLNAKSSTPYDAPGRLIVAEETWQKFLKVHDDILHITTDEDELEKEEDYRFEVEELYLGLRALLQPFISHVQPTEVSKVTSTLTDNSEASIPNIGFTPYSENETFRSFLMRLNNYFELKRISDPKNKTYLFISTLSPEMHQTLCDILAPEKPGDMSFEELSHILQECFEPTPSILANQHKFVSRIQDHSEGISVYARDLKRLTVDCDFKCYACEKSVNDMFLKMQFIRGLKDNDIRIKLLQEKGNKKTFKEVVETAISIEQSKLEGNEINANNHASGKQFVEVNSFKQVPMKMRTKEKGNENKQLTTFQDLKGKCYRCGNEKHRANFCKFKNEFCRKCGKIGHIANVCLSSNIRNDNERPRQLMSNMVETEEENSGNYEIYMMESSSKVSDKFMLNISIEGKDLNMELDTGAALSSLSYDDFKLLNLTNRLFKTGVEMKTYTGEVIKPVGVCFVKCKYRDFDFHGKLYVLKQKVDPIFGREWLREVKMDWADIKLVENRSSEQLDELLASFQGIFKPEIGEIPSEQGHIQLKEGAKPIFIKPRQVPYALRKAVEDELHRLESNGIITKIENSEWGTPIVPVMKPNGSVRLCADYKVTANKLILDEKYPIPRIEDIYAQMNKGKFFCTLDISNAYLHLSMDEESRDIQTISTHQGLYKVNRLMFGIKVAPSIWQRFMDKVLNGLEGTVCFFDDILVQGSTFHDTMKRLKAVFERLKQFNLRLNRDKCKFFQKSVKYLGHVIDESGLHKSPENVEAILKATRPRDIHELRTFIGLANYYNRFIPNMSTLLDPLYNLLRQGNKFTWTKDCEKTFLQVKKQISSEQTLTHYDPCETLTLATDASPTGLGACLSHRYRDGTEKPIAFASRSLTKTERKYSQIDKEALGIFWGLKKFFAYCYGRRFILITDHKPLVSIFDPSKTLPAMTASRMFNYAHFLSGFDYRIEYRSTTKHANADFLSRFPVTVPENVYDDHEHYFMHQIEMMPITRKQIQEETKQDTELKLILQYLIDGKSLKDLGLEDSEFCLQNGCIFRGNRICVPLSLRRQVLNELHAGHMGMTKMKLLARSYCYWKNMDQEIEHLVKQCLPCRQKLKNPPKETIHPWEPPNGPWERIHIDFAGPIKGWWYLIVVDAFSKWVEVVPTKSTTTAWCIRQLDRLFSTFGFPHVLVSDNGTQLTSATFEDYLKRYRIMHKTIAPFHPKSNGQAERVVQTIKNLLHASGSGDIDKRLNTILKQLRKAQHTTTGRSPYQLMFGRNIRTELDLMVEDCSTIQNKKDEPKRSFSIGQKVLVKNYSTNSNEKWTVGRVEHRLGNVIYLVRVEDGRLWKRHIDQINAV